MKVRLANWYEHNEERYADWPNDRRRPYDRPAIYAEYRPGAAQDDIVLVHCGCNPNECSYCYPLYVLAAPHSEEAAAILAAQ